MNVNISFNILEVMRILPERGRESRRERERERERGRESVYVFVLDVEADLLL